MSNAKKEILSPAHLESVARLFAVLSEPNRLAVLQALHDGPLSVTELVRLCSIKQANVSKHLSILHDHHLVRRRRLGASVHYEIADPMIFTLCRLVCGKMEKDARQDIALFGRAGGPVAARGKHA
jgi:DNA-binding transcriptional ArsR family regulator